MRKYIWGILLVLFLCGATFAGKPAIEKTLDPDLICADLNPDTYWFLNDEMYWLLGHSPVNMNGSMKYKDSGRSGKGVAIGSSVLDAWGIDLISDDPAEREALKFDSDKINSIDWNNLRTGNPEVVIAIIDTGIRWKTGNDKTRKSIIADLMNRLYLNKGELAGHAPDYILGMPVWDTNNDGRFSAADYEPEGRKMVIDTSSNVKDPDVSMRYTYTAGGYNGHPAFFRVSGSSIVFVNDPNGNGLLDPQDLIKTFSDGSDDDNNNFADDICGWDFFEDDNDPEDVSSYTDTAIYHGEGQTELVAAELGNGYIGSGICPDCSVLVLKAWDSFLHDEDYYGLAVLYAADNGAHVIEGALGSFNSSGICRDAVKYAYQEKGMPVFMVSSDMNTANHNQPTYLDEPVFCSGMVPDVFGIPRIKPGTYFRNSNMTQYGPKNQIAFEVQTGSMSAALSSGAAGLIISQAMKLANESIMLGRRINYANGTPLHPDQIKQILTLTCEDILPENTEGYSRPDPAQSGWDQHFGYGRVNMKDALNAVDEGKIPCVARITSPSWSSYFDPRKDSLIIKGDILPAGDEKISWVLEAAAGVEPFDKEFREISRGSSTGKDIVLVDRSLDCIKDRFPNGTDFSWYPNEPETKPYGDAKVQPNRLMFTVRLKVTSVDMNFNWYRYPQDRRAFFICEDKSLHDGWPVYIGAGGEASPRFEDLDGDNLSEVILATSDGRILVFTHDGRTFKALGREIIFYADEMDMAANHKMKIEGKPLRPSFMTPSIADIDNDGIKEIVSTAGGYIYCFKATGERVFKEPFCVKSMNGAQKDNFFIDVEQGEVKNYDNDPLWRENSIGPGSTAAPVLYDLDGDGKIEVILGAQDQRLYAWHSDGSRVSGWPVYVREKSYLGGRITNPPCLANLDGTGRMEIIVTTNEADSGSKAPATTQKEKLLAAFKSSGSSAGLSGGVLNAVMGALSKFIGKGCMVYAVKASGIPGGRDGSQDISLSSGAFVKGWPVAISALLPDLLPQIGPSAKPCAFDYDGDGMDEVVATFLSAPTSIIDGNGKVIKTMNHDIFGKNAIGIKDKSICLNVFNAAALGDITGDGTPEIATGGSTLFMALNLLISGLNLDYNHVVQAWDVKSGRYLDAYPRSTDDFMIGGEPALADVTGDGIPEIIAGSGLYLLHAYGADGMDKDSFPKLTGGWIMSSPAVSDIDNDGLNEIAVVTREGWLFVWDSNGKNAATPDWPTYGHDNMTTSNLRTDAVPPANVTEYEWTDDGFTFRMPGDDGYNGKAKTVCIYGYDSPINAGNIRNATLLKSLVTSANGKMVYINMPDDYRCYAVVATDEAGNKNQLFLEGGLITDSNGKGVQVSSEESDSGSSGGACFINTASF